MGAGSTQTYRVETIYEVVDRTSKSVREIEKATKDAASATNNLVQSLKGVGLAFVGSSVFHKAKSMLIDYNKELEDSKVQIAGMISMFSTAPLEKAWDRAGQSVERFQQMAKKSSLTTRDLVDTAGLLTRPLMQAGLSMREIEDLSFGVANASKAFGIGKEVAGRDVEQALTVGVHQMDRFAMNILGSIGMSKDKFNALTQDQKVQALKKGLTSESITAMAKKQGEDTFSGVTSTLEDTVQIMASKAGAPLFKAITDEIKNWNAWLEKNDYKLQEIGKTVGETLMTGFKYVKEAFSWLYDHADTLLSIGKVWAAVKVGQFVGGLSMGGGGAIGGAFGSALSSLGERVEWGVRHGFAKLPGGSSFMSGLSRVGQSLSGVAGAAGAIGPGGALAIGMAAYEISKATGVRDRITEAIDPMAAAVDRAERSLKLFDESLRSAQRAAEGQQFGAAGTQIYGGYQKAQTEQTQVIEAYRDAMMEIAKGPGIGGLGGVQKRLRERLEGTGQTDTDVKAFMEGDAASQMYMIQQQMNKRSMSGVTHDTDVAEASGLSLRVRMAEDMKGMRFDSEFWNKANNLLLQKVVLAAQEGRRLTEDEAKKAVKDLAESEGRDIRGTKQLKQTVNVTIQQVTAKDPHRWLMDLTEDAARKMNNSPTRAKGSWSTPGS